MKNMGWSDDNDALHEDLAAPLTNERLLRYIGMRDALVAGIDGGHLVRADTSFLGTDFP